VCVCVSVPEKETLSFVDNCIITLACLGGFGGLGALFRLSYLAAIGRTGGSSIDHQAGINGPLAGTDTRVARSNQSGDFTRRHPGGGSNG